MINSVVVEQISTIKIKMLIVCLLPFGCSSEIILEALVM